MATTRFADHLTTGNHASRPAASAVPAGALYSCITHSLVYQSDGSSTWSTYIDLTAPVSSSPTTLVFPGATSPAQTAEGSAVWDTDDDVLTVGDGASRSTFGKLGSTAATALTKTAAAGSSKEASRVDHAHSGILTTKGDLLVTDGTSYHRLAVGSNNQVLTADSAQTDGVKWAAGGGGGLAHSTLGTTSAGGSFESPSAGITYLKKVTLASNSLVAAIVAHVQGNNANAAGLGCHIYNDSAGAPVNVIASGRPIGSDGSGTAQNNIQMNTTARWVGMPVGLWLTAGDYWLAVMLSPNGNTGAIQIAYAASGSDKTQAHGLRDLDISIVGTSSTSNNYSIYADILS